MSIPATILCMAKSFPQLILDAFVGANKQKNQKICKRKIRGQRVAPPSNPTNSWFSPLPGQAERHEVNGNMATASPTVPVVDGDGAHCFMLKTMPAG